MTTNANVIARDKAVIRAYYELDERERVRSVPPLRRGVLPDGECTYSGKWAGPSDDVPSKVGARAVSDTDWVRIA
jgi:hypothetical protein